MKSVWRVFALTVFGVLLLSSCASRETSDPGPPDSEPSLQAAGKTDIEIGRELFVKHTCDGCHVNGGNIMEPDDPLKGKHFLEKYPTDDMIVKVVRNGKPETPMQPFSKDELSDSELTYIVAYIRSLTPKEDSAESKESE